MACTIGLHNDITKRDEISWKHDTKPLYCTCIYIHGTKGDACFVNGRRGGEGEGGRIYAFPSRLDALPFFLVAVGLEQDNMAVIGPLSLTQMCIILGLSFCSPRTHTRTHKPTPEAAQAPEACAPNILLFFFFHSFLFPPLCLLSLLLLLLFFSFFPAPPHDSISIPIIHQSHYAWVYSAGLRPATAEKNHFGKKGKKGQRVMPKCTRRKISTLGI